MVNPFIYESGKEISLGAHGEHSYVFASDSPVTDAGLSEYVFESGTGLGGGVIDTFERGDLSPYTGSGFSIVSSPVIEGSYALKAPSNNSEIYSNSLPNIPKRGTTFHAVFRIDSEYNALQMTYGHQGNRDNSYNTGIRVDGSGQFYLEHVKDSNPSGVGISSPFSGSLGTWYGIEVVWADPNIQATLYSMDGQTEIVKGSFDDTTYDSGNFGWDTSNSNTSANSYEKYADAAQLGVYSGY